MEPEWTVRATSFGAVADDYDRFRPAPPSEVADWLLPEGAARVVDLCAGTGGFTRVLETRVSEVLAVELDPRMLAVLELRSPAVMAVCGRGEALPLQTASVDAVTVSSAWHWLDPDLCVPEIARVLRPGGVLGVVWNGPARHIDWVDQLLGESRRPRPDRARPRHQLILPSGQPFGELESHLIDWTLPRTSAELIGLTGTYSGVITSPRAERQAAIERVVRFMGDKATFGDAEKIDLPMRARCWKAIRL